MSKHTTESGHFGWCPVCTHAVDQRSVSDFDHSVTYYCHKGDILRADQLLNTPTGMPPTNDVAAPYEGATITHLSVPIHNFNETDLIKALDFVMAAFLDKGSHMPPVIKENLREEASRAAKWLTSKYSPLIWPRTTP